MGLIGSLSARRVARRVAVVLVMTWAGVLGISAVALGCTASGVRIGDHPAYVRAVVDFTGGTIATGQVTAGDPNPYDGRAALQVDRSGIRTRVRPTRGDGITVRVLQARNRIRVEIRSARGRLKYLSYQVVAGTRLAIDLWKSAPPSRAAEIRRGTGGCLTLDSSRVATGMVTAAGHERNLFEHQFQLRLRAPDGRLIATRTVHVSAGAWRAPLRYRLSRWQVATLEAVDFSAKDGTLVCLAQVRVTLPAADAGADAVYAVNRGSNTISQYDVGLDGTLRAKSPATVATGRGSEQMAVSPDGRSLYVTNLDSNTVSEYSVGAGGALRPKTPATISTPGPMGVVVSPDGRSVYVANYGGGVVSEFNVGARGVLTPKTQAAVPVPSPRSVAVSPNGRNAYVVTDSGLIFQYDIGTGGILSPASPATVTSGLAPGYLAITPDSRSVYVNGYYDRTIHQYDAGPDGTLTPKSPATVAIASNPGFIAVRPDGRSVYVATEYTIHQYDVTAGGALAPKSSAFISGFAFASAIALSADGRDAYVANTNGGSLSQLSVRTNGTLIAKTPARVAAQANPVDVVTLPAPGGL